MTDILVRGLPDDVVANIDQRSAELGISRAEFMRRALVNSSQRSTSSVTSEALRASIPRLSGLLDDELMSRAWQ